MVTTQKKSTSRPEKAAASHSWRSERQHIGSEREQPGAFYAAAPAVSLGAPVQAQLTVNPPGDRYEQEADQVADSVMRMPVQGGVQRQEEAPEEEVQTMPLGRVQRQEEAPEEEVQTMPLGRVQRQEEVPEEDAAETTLQTKPQIQRLCAECEAEMGSMQRQEEEEEGPVQTMPTLQRQEEEEGAELQTMPLVQRVCTSCGAALGDERTVQRQEEEEEAPAVQTKPAISRIGTGGDGAYQPARLQLATELPDVPENVAPEEAPGAEAVETAAPEEEAAAEAPPEEAEGEQVALPEPEPLPEEDEVPPIQTRSNGAGAPAVGTTMTSALASSKGAGRPMSPRVRADMERGFGRDLSQVRVHTDGAAGRMNRDLRARAFTHQSDIYFSPGEYRPESSDGRRLLAHELTHTIQQGAVSDSIQRFTAPPQDVTVEGPAERPDDGAEVEGRINEKIDGDPNVKKQDEASEEEKEKLKKPDRGEVRSESSGITGEAKPSVDRGAAAQEKTAEQKAQIDEQVNETSEEAAAEEGGGEGEEAQLSEADAAAQRALSAEAQAGSVPIPAEPQPFRHPRIDAPVDSAGEPLPRNSQIDTQVRGLGYIAEMLRTKGYEMKRHSANETRASFGLDSVLEREREDLANAKEGTALIETHTEARKEIADQSHVAHTESVSRQQFVAEKAPDLASKADEGQEDSGALASESRSNAEQSQGEIPDDPDAAADAQEQAGEMNSSADGAASMDQAIQQTGARARQYEQDAAAASEQNEQSDEEIAETEDVITQTETRTEEMQASNEASQEQIDGSAAGPSLIRQFAQRDAQSGDELIAATIVMEQELNSLQEEYLTGMAGIESRETAIERQQREQEEADQAGMSPEEERLFELAGLSEEEQEQRVSEMEQPERDGLLATLEGMIQQTPDQGTDATEGARLRVDTGLTQSIMGEQPADPRQEQIQGVENRRIERVGGVLDVADRNMTFLTAEQQRMLANRLVSESITDDISNINVLQMGKDMIAGMIDPRQSLTAVIGGFEKMATGFANIGNLEAWRRDPVGNLLQIAADISTGLAMIFSTILGIAAIITAIMVALTILSWGFLSPVTAPVIGWMGTVMTYAGWGAIIAGGLSVYFNYLAYIKNLHDAGTAETARELFGNTEQMKQNVTDGFQGAMAVVEGVGAVKMAPGLRSGQFFQSVPRSPGAWGRGVVQAGREGLGALRAAPAAIGRGARALFSGGRQGLVRFKERVQRLFARRRPGRTDIDINPPESRPRRTTADGRHHTSVTPDGRIVRCSEKCTLMRSEFDAELNSRRDLKRELDEIEDLGRRDPAAADARAAELEPRLREVRRVRQLSDADLEAEIANTPKTNNRNDPSNALRHERYRRGGGDKDFDDWFSTSRGGRPGSPEHQADVTANNGPPNNLVPRAVGNRVADGVGRPGQAVNLRGHEIKPQGNGRVIVEADHTIRNGTMPDSAARAQMRDMRAADPNATLVVTDLNSPSSPPLVYPPGTQPPPPGRLSPGQQPTVPYPDT